MVFSGGEETGVALTCRRNNGNIGIKFEPTAASGTGGGLLYVGNNGALHYYNYVTSTDHTIV